MVIWVRFFQTELMADLSDFEKIFGRCYRFLKARFTQKDCKRLQAKDR